MDSVPPATLASMPSPQPSITMNAADEGAVEHSVGQSIGLLPTPSQSGSFELSLVTTTFNSQVAPRKMSAGMPLHSGSRLHASSMAMPIAASSPYVACHDSLQTQSSVSNKQK
jgi:hypothetical protein